jgi:purine-binding chemotaxis protein CheW
MDRKLTLVVFTLDAQRYGIHLSNVERVIRVVELTPLPQAPEMVLGVVNVQGRIVPVVNIRKRFRLPEREINLSDQLIIAHTSRRAVALMVETVTGVVERSEKEVIAAEDILPHLEHVEGVVKLEDGLVLIHNLDNFLSLDEEKILDDAIRKT